MADLAKLVVKLEAQTAQYTQQLDKVNKKMAGFEKRQRRSLKNVGAGFKALGTIAAGVGIAAFIRKVVRATAAQEQAVAQLRQGLISTDNAVGFSLGQLTKYAADLQKVTTFGDEELIQAQAQLITFTKITGDEFNRTLIAATDLSARMGGDLKSSVIQLGKALNDPIANLSALSRSGIQFSADQKTLVKSLFETGREAEAQQVILKELEVQFGGSARAARDTFGGALEGLSNAFGDLLESNTGLTGATDAIEEITTLLQDPATIAAFDTWTSALISIAAVSVQGVNKWVEAFENIAAAVVGPAADDIVRLNKQLDVNRFRLQQINAISFKTDLTDNLIAEEQALLRDNVALQQKINLSNELFGTQEEPGVAPGSAPTATATAPEPEKFLEDFGFIAAEAQRTGQVVSDSIATMFEDIGLGIENTPELDAKLESINAFLRTETEAIEFEYERRLEMLRQLEENKQLTTEEFAAKSSALEMKKTDDILAAKQREIAGEKSLMGQLAGIQTTGSKKLNKITKAASLANATMRGFETIQAAWALGFPAALVAVPVAIAVTAANIAGIQGAAHGGLTNVPAEGTFLLDKGERVLSPSQNKDFTASLKPGGSNNAPPVVNIFPSAFNVDGIEDFFVNQRGFIAGLISDAMNDQGRAGLV